MSTTIRPEITEKKKYWVSKHRYYELKHFCMQYGEWKKRLNAMNLCASKSVINTKKDSNQVSDPTCQCTAAREFYRSRIEMLEKVSKEADPIIGDYILKGVTEEMPYDILITRGLDCSKNRYYELYRKFFWLLSMVRK